jgi:hypothetical protein
MIKSKRVREQTASGHYELTSLYPGNGSPSSPRLLLMAERWARAHATSGASWSSLRGRSVERRPRSYLPAQRGAARGRPRRISIATGTGGSSGTERLRLGSAADIPETSRDDAGRRRFGCPDGSRNQGQRWSPCTDYVERLLAAESPHRLFRVSDDSWRRGPTGHDRSHATSKTLQNCEQRRRTSRSSFLLAGSRPRSRRAARGYIAFGDTLPNVGGRAKLVAR